jgi:hypothetical protein
VVGECESDLGADFYFLFTAKNWPWQRLLLCSSRPVFMTIRFGEHQHNPRALRRRARRFNRACSLTDPVWRCLDYPSYIQIFSAPSSHVSQTHGVQSAPLLPKDGATEPAYTRRNAVRKRLFLTAMAQPPASRGCPLLRNLRSHSFPISRSL